MRSVPNGPGYQMPRWRVIEKSRPRNDFAAGAPSARITFGDTICSSRSRYSRQFAISSGDGARLVSRPLSVLVARHLIVFVMKTSSRRSPMAASILFSSSPARPTKGSPWRSSCSPGPSPTMTRGEAGSPTPQTTFVRVEPMAHRRQASACACRAESCCCRCALASSNEGITSVPHEHRAPRDEHDADEDGGVQDVPADERGAERPVPEQPVVLDPVKPAAALAPVEHAALTPCLFGTPGFPFVGHDALRQIDDSQPAFAQPVSEIDLLVVEEKALVKPSHLCEY